MPVCKQCFKEKAQDLFYKHPQTTSWYLSICIDCKREYALANRTKEKDKIRYRSSHKKRLNIIYHALMSRCYNKNCRNYARYGWRWIKVERKHYNEFYKDMYLSYILHRESNWKLNNRQTQIDRIDNNWNYCKANCTRVTAKENNQNNKI